MSMLCKLSDVKTILGIPQDDTSKDAKLTLYIKSASAKIEGYLGYSLGYGTYTEELHSVNNRQLLQLNHFPVWTVSAVTANGVPVDDYKIIPEYRRWGRLYRGAGWTGPCYTRGFTHDIVSGAWDITVSYTAGYYLPNDIGYVEGAENSLPYDIVSACMQMVQLRYTYDINGAICVKSHHEGNISDTYGDGSCDAGMTDGVKTMLASYVYYGVA